MKPVVVNITLEADKLFPQDDRQLDQVNKGATYAAFEGAIEAKIRSVLVEPCLILWNWCTEPVFGSVIVEGWRFQEGWQFDEDLSETIQDMVEEALESSDWAVYWDW